MLKVKYQASFAAVFSAFMVSSALLGMSAMPACAQDSSSPRHKHRHLTHAIYTRPEPASFIVDVDSGKILESENADSQRYPASLTKMMTLYLTFDALKKGALKLDQTIPVSEHAASQPQTNIALQPGERIAVKDAILSIVIRSANDSAVTLGEALGGGSEEAFAQKMTHMAHSLGMNHTEFRNASGLPEPAQHTTARDMATLGLALRKNFPQYFPFFKTESFSYHGKTYLTHNHVMTRYDGVDGIKTGYIRASGFNLVTSVKRDGHALIAVVLGGSTIRARDDKMIALLDRTYTQLAAKDGKKNIQLASAERKVSAFPAKQESDEPQEGEGDLPGDEVKAASSAPAADDSASAAIAAAAPTITGWAIQVGAFAKALDAKDAASRSVAQAPDELKSSVISVSDSDSIHRARLVNLTQDQAENACRKLAAIHQPCFAYKIN
jgi:D-alanyl-D-alanine carboxypeptidase